MAGWSAVLALTGFHYSAVTNEMTLAAKNGTFFWSDGYAWGIVVLSESTKGKNMVLNVLHGDLNLKKIILSGYGEKTFRLIHLKEEESMSLMVKPNNPEAGLPEYQVDVNRLNSLHR